MYDVLDILLTVDLEGDAAGYEFVGHHAHTPDIHSIIVGFAPDDLR